MPNALTKAVRSISNSTSKTKFNCSQSLVESLSAQLFEQNHELSQIRDDARDADRISALAASKIEAKENEAQAAKGLLDLLSVEYTERKIELEELHNEIESDRKRLAKEREEYPALQKIAAHATRRMQFSIEDLKEVRALNVALRSDKLATEKACAETLLKNKNVGSEAVEERDRLQSEFEEYKTARELQITTCKEGMEKLQAEVDSLKSDMASFEKKAREAEAALEEQKEKNLVLKKECDHVTGRLCTALGSAESSKQDQERSVVAVRDAEIEIATLKKQLESLTAEQEQHAAEKSTSSSSNRALQDKITELTETNANFAKEKEMLEIKVRQLDEQCERLSDKHQNELNDKENIILDLQAEVDKCKETAFSLGEHIENQQGLIQELEMENDQLQGDRDALKEEISRGLTPSVTPDVTPTHAGAANAANTSFMDEDLVTDDLRQEWVDRIRPILAGMVNVETVVESVVSILEDEYRKSHHSKESDRRSFEMIKFEKNWIVDQNFAAGGSKILIFDSNFLKMVSSRLELERKLAQQVSANNELNDDRKQLWKKIADKTSEIDAQRLEISSLLHRLQKSAAATPISCSPSPNGPMNVPSIVPEDEPTRECTPDQNELLSPGAGQQTAQPDFSDFDFAPQPASPCPQGSPII